MIDFVQSGVAYLNEPQLVARFQRYFGVQRKIKPEITSSSNNAQQQQRNNATPTSQQQQVDADSSSSSSDSEQQQQNEGSLLSDEYTVAHPLWHLLFKFGTGLGDEIFYASIFPFWFWNIDGAVGRRIINIWALSMYIGQCLKDIICWPRPLCPPVIRMEKKWAMEYGMPSTHAMVSVTVPFSVILLTANRYEYSIWAGVVVGCLWCVLVSTSRLYLGMHSLADILAGMMLASVLLPILLPLVDFLDSFLLTHPAAPCLLITTTVTLMLVYPGSKFSSAREDTAVILGSAMGLYLGAWMSYQMGSIRGPPMKPPYSILWPSFEMLGTSILRTVIGLVTVVATRALAKPLGRTVTRTLLLLVKESNNAKEEEMEANVKLGTKLFTYGLVGVDVTWLAPAVFRLLTIERPTFHTEI